MPKKVVIIVDGTNLYMGGKENQNLIWPPDLKSLLLPHLKGEVDSVVQTHYFTSVDKDNASQQRAINHIQKSGVLVYDYELKKYHNKDECPMCNKICSECGRDLRIKPHKEKMIDIAVCTKLIELAYQTVPSLIDSFVIVSGDKDIIPAIRHVRKKLGKEVIVAGYRRITTEVNRLAYEMDKEVDQIINLYEINKKT